MESARGEFRPKDSVLELGSGQASVPGSSGSLEFADGEGTLRVDTGAINWSWPEVFERPLAISTFSGNADWLRDGETTRVQMREVAFETPHLEGSLEGSLEWSESDSEPVMGLRLRVARGDLSHLPEYLPMGVLHPDLSTWIAESIHGGQLEEGELRIEGALRNWPFDDGEGSVSARARVSKVELRYAPGWPAIQDLAAELRFEGRHAEFELSGGRVQGAQITRARLDVPRMGDDRTTLEIVGELSGTTSQAADFLRNSPLAPRFLQVLDAVSARGPADLALQIVIPLPEGRKQVAGRAILLFVRRIGEAAPADRRAGHFVFDVAVYRPWERQRPRVARLICARSRCVRPGARRNTGAGTDWWRPITTWRFMACSARACVMSRRWARLGWR